VSRRLILLLPLLALTACGKAGSPMVPGSGFPHAYPDPKLAPTAPVHAAAPEDQPGVQGDAGKAKFTDQGSYIDPAVRSTELQRNAVTPGATLPYSQTQPSGGSSPFNQGLNNYNLSPLGPPPSATPTEDEQQPQ